MMVLLRKVVLAGDDAGACDVTGRSLLEGTAVRPDGGRRLIFVPDACRSIALSEHEGRPAVITYTNVRIHRGVVISGLERITVVPQWTLVYEQGLFGAVSPSGPWANR